MNKEIISLRLIEDLLHTTKSSAHVKDAITGKYVDSNLENLKKFGLNKPEQIIGHTMLDLNGFMEKYWGNQLVKDIEKLEEQVKITQQRQYDVRSFLAADGKIWVHDMVKIPLINSKGKVFSIYTVSDNITSKQNLFSLWGLYLKFYSTKNRKIAIKKYLEHINVLVCFHELPTIGELYVLLARCQNHSSKGIANILKISHRTVETHICRLKDKAKLDLALIISMVRIIE